MRTGGEVEPLRVMACVCTYQRNEPLRRLLDRLSTIAHASSSRFQLGVVVVDDNPDGAAEPVVLAFSDRFPLGVQYRRSGEQNISIGRNIAVETGCDHGDVLVMTDDDCVPELTWIDRLLDTYVRTNAEAVSGPLVTDLPDDAPSWISEQRVFDFDHPPIPDGAVLDAGETNNSLLDVAWLRSHPEHRFDPEFGRIGGEDMMFFRGAKRLGMISVHSSGAIVHQHEPLEELSYVAMLKGRYWWGNSEAVTNIASGSASRRRVLLRGAKRLLQACAMPLRRLLQRRSPHLRVAALTGARAVGTMTGAFGIRANHH